MNSPVVRFRLYIAGDAPHSQRATANLYSFCEAHFPERYDIEIIDLYVEPERALADMILLTPTLAIVAPPPLRSIVGDLGETSVLLHALAAELRRQ